MQGESYERSSRVRGERDRSANYEIKRIDQQNGELSSNALLLVIANLRVGVRLIDVPANDDRIGVGGDEGSPGSTSV